MRRAIFLLLAACTATPSDDPDAYDVDTKREWTVRATEPRYIAPSTKLPVKTLASNNNVAIVFHEGRLFMGFRTSDLHFASVHTKMHVMSTDDDGKTWRKERSFELGSDAREPIFISFLGKLRFMFFQAGTNPFAFEPQAILRSEWQGAGRFSEPVQIAGPEEVPWDVKVRRGRVWMTSYKGNHYQGGAPQIEVSFKVSDDGLTFAPVNPDRPVVYTGGVSEVAYEFDAAGNLWAVTRNEDGDSSGFGSHLCFAPKDALADWQCPAKSSPFRYDSPEMFRHGNDIYLVARRDPISPYDMAPETDSFSDRQTSNLLGYSSRPKRTALYKIDQDAREIVHLFDLPGAGDTSFPSVHRLDAHRFLLANYTSPLGQDRDPTWFEGQTSELGTQIYLTTLIFE